MRLRVLNKPQYPKILLIGSGGQLGCELKRSLCVQSALIAVDRRRLDLSSVSAIQSVVRDCAPNVIVNAAAWTAVDKAETETAGAQAINAIAPAVLADEALRLGARLIHYSTDYVFDGTKSTPYSENDSTAPINAYGQSKRDGELAILDSGADAVILRTSWVFGLHGANFMKTMLRLGRERDEMSVIDDQFGAPTWTRHLADATALLSSKSPNVKGIFHLTAGGRTTWFDYARTIFEEAHRLGLMAKVPQLRRVASTNWPTPAKRPANSVLDCSRLREQAGISLPDWRVGVRDCLTDLQLARI
jgi:dTDP-4-dehydrorhamnose reductase